MAALLQPAAPATAQVPYAEPTAEQVRADMLSIHNSYRAQFNIKPLAWDEKLASDAADYLAQHAKGGDLPPPPAPTGTRPAENSHRSAAGALRPYAMAENWAAERFNLPFGAFPGAPQTLDAPHVRHYAIMMQESTARFGCAARRVKGFDYLLCRYG